MRRRTRRRLPAVLAAIGLLAGPAGPHALAAAPAATGVPDVVLVADADGEGPLAVFRGGESTLLTEGAADAHPATGPEGRRVAFARYAEGEDEGVLGLADLVTGAVVATEVPVARATSEERPVQWRPDGLSLVVTTDEGISVVDAVTTAARPVPGTRPGDVLLDVSPLGRQLVVRRAADPERGQQSLVALGLDGTNLRRLWIADSGMQAGPISARFSPDGQSIAFLTEEQTSLGPTRTLGFTDIVDGSEYEGQAVDNPVTVARGVAWHPDGRHVLLAVEEDGRGRLEARARGQSEPTVLARLDRAPITAEWTLGGAGVITLTEAGGGTQLELVATSDGARERLARIPAAEPVLVPPVRRLAGIDRIGTAVAVSQASVGARETDTVVLARADAYADALAGGPFAASLGAPLLLTGSAGLDADTGSEIRRVGARKVVLLGGEAALSEQVVTDLKAIGVREVERLFGAERFATAAAIAAALPGDADHIYLVQGSDPDPARGWADAVSAAPLAAADGAPLLLTGTDELPDATRAALRGSDAEAVTIVGGTAAVADRVARAVEQAGDFDVDRIAGATRYGTSAEVARSARARDLGSPATTWTATGSDWPDSLAAGPAVAETRGLLVLVDPNSLSNSPETRALLEDVAGEVGTVRLVGGEAAISTATAVGITTTVFPIVAVPDGEAQARR